MRMQIYSMANADNARRKSKSGFDVMKIIRIITLSGSILIHLVNNNEIITEKFDERTCDEHTFHQMA